MNEESTAKEVLQGIDPYTQPSFSLANRIARALWALGYVLLFRFSPRPFHSWRTLVLKCFGAKIGKACHVYPKVKIWAPWNLVIEDQAGIADDVICYSMATIHIGNKAVISQGAHLCTGTHDYRDPNFQLYAQPIDIGERAWICTEAFVAPGVNVGSGAVVAARSVVTKDIPQWMVCGGNPCKPIKPRVMRN